MKMKREFSVASSRGDFMRLFLGGYLLAIAYGVSLLIPLLVEGRGGDEAFAGVIISMATLGTLLFVTFSGHLADLLGLSKSVALSAFLLVCSMAGFSLSRGLGFDLLLYGFLLGVGWGVFYVLIPIVLAVIVKPEGRVRFFALLSGSLMAGIGSGPLIGRLLSAPVNLSRVRFWWRVGQPVESAFLVAGLCREDFCVFMRIATCVRTGMLFPKPLGYPQGLFAELCVRLLFFRSSRRACWGLATA